MLAEADDDAGQKKNNKRDALRSAQSVPFSMFDPIVAFEAINSNWINVPEVAKLGIQAAHKKIALAREERLELQRAMETLQKQFRGMQEHHVQQMTAQSSRVDFLERSTKRKKKYRSCQGDLSGRSGEMFRQVSPGAARSTMAGREMLQQMNRRKSKTRDTMNSNVTEESSDESSVQGLTTEQQDMLDKIQPLESQICELEVGRRKELERAEAFLKRLEKHQHQTELLENRLNDELSTRALSLLFRQLIFTELPTTLESFMSDKFQAFKKMTESVEKKLEGEMALLAKKEHSLAKSLHGLTNHLRDLEEEVHALAQRSSSSSEDSRRGLAREASAKLFAGSTSPRVSRSALTQREETPGSSRHEAPDFPGLSSDDAARARMELLMGNGPPVDQTASEGVSDASPRRGSATTPQARRSKSAKSAKSEALRRSGTDTSEGSADQELEGEGLRSSQEIRKKRGSRQVSSRTSPRTLRSQLSELSDEDLAISQRRMSLPRLVEESLVNFLQSEKFSSLMDEIFDLTSVTKSVQQQIQQISQLEAHRTQGQQDAQRHSEQLKSCSNATLELREHLGHVQQQIDQRINGLEKRLRKAEEFSERGLDAILATTEGRILEFLAEGEAERARLWYQMSVLFPRFSQENENGNERMSMSEARAFALDVRLDHLEDHIVQNSAPSLGRASSHRPSRQSLRPHGIPETGEHGQAVTSGAGSDSDAAGSSPRKSASAVENRRSPSLAALDPRRASCFEPRFSLPPEPFKAAEKHRGSRLHEVLKHLEEDLTVSPPASPHLGDGPNEPPTLLVKAPRLSTSIVSFEDEKAQIEEPPTVGSEHFYDGEGGSVGTAPEVSLLFPAHGPETVPEEDGTPEAGEAVQGTQAEQQEQQAQARPDWNGRRSVHEALSDVMDETRNLGTGEVQLIRALNPRSPNTWLIGDAAAGRVILGQEPPLPHPATLRSPPSRHSAFRPRDLRLP